MRVVLVTGASRGIGSQLCEYFLDSGCRVIGIARSETDSWQLANHKDLSKYKCDATSESEVKVLFSSLRKELGAVDLLINNVGQFHGQLLQLTSSEQFMTILRTNLLTAHLVTREYAKLMKPHGRGCAVSISSIATVLNLQGNATYGLAKSAVDSLMRSYALEYKDTGLTFNSVAVSFIENTTMTDRLSESVRASYTQRLLTSVPITINQLAQTIEFLATSNAKPITGQTIFLGSPS